VRIVRRPPQEATIVPPADIESLFEKPPDYPYADGVVNNNTIKHAARTAAEFLHTERPDAVIAADRGGRLLALATLHTWRKRYPGERFPTRDGGIAIARLTAKELGIYDYTELVGQTLQRAGVIDRDRRIIETPDRRARDTKISFMDDWVHRGTSFGMFNAAAAEYGIKPYNLSAITMCNKVMDGVRHVVNPAFQVWEMSAWKDDGDAIGVDYSYHPAMPRPTSSVFSRRQREEIIANIDRYFEDYEVALQAGTITACDCVEVTEL
jgi:hypothetical protein